jgi:hypothetical protein
MFMATGVEVPRAPPASSLPRTVIWMGAIPLAVSESTCHTSGSVT